MLRALILLFRGGIARRTIADDSPNSSFSMTNANEDTPHNQSPEALSARLDVIEARLDDKQAVHRLEAEATLARLPRTHKAHG